MSFKENEKADEAGNEAAKKNGIGRCPERLTSLAHVGRTISERKWREAKHRFWTENDRRPQIQ